MQNCLDATRLCQLVDAFERGNLDECLRLLEDLKQTPPTHVLLARACMSGNEIFVRHLIEKLGWDACTSPEPLLRAAAAGGHWELVAYLLEATGVNCRQQKAE